MRIWHSCFLVNFAKFLRTSFSQNTFGRLLLNVYNLNFFSRYKFKASTYFLYFFFLSQRTFHRICLFRIVWCSVLSHWLVSSFFSSYFSSEGPVLILYRNKTFYISNIYWVSWFITMTKINFQLAKIFFSA